MSSSIGVPWSFSLHDLHRLYALLTLMRVHLPQLRWMTDVAVSEHRATAHDDGGDPMVSSGKRLPLLGGHLTDGLDQLPLPRRVLLRRLLGVHGPTRSWACPCRHLPRDGGLVTLPSQPALGIHSSFLCSRRSGRHHSGCSPRPQSTVRGGGDVGGREGAVEAMVVCASGVVVRQLSMGASAAESR